MKPPGNSAHMRSESAWCSRKSRNADAMSRFAISISNTGREAVVDANNRAMDSIDGTRTG